MVLCVLEEEGDEIEDNGIEEESGTVVVVVEEEEEGCNEDCSILPRGLDFGDALEEVFTLDSWEGFAANALFLRVKNPGFTSWRLLLTNPLHFGLCCDDDDDKEFAPPNRGELIWGLLSHVWSVDVVGGVSTDFFTAAC